MIDYAVGHSVWTEHRTGSVCVCCARPLWMALEGSKTTRKIPRCNRCKMQKVLRCNRLAIDARELMLRLSYTICTYKTYQHTLKQVSQTALLLPVWQV